MNYTLDDFIFVNWTMTNWTMTNWTDFTDLEQYVTSYFNQFSSTITSFTNMTSFIDILSEFNTDWILDWFTGTPSSIEGDMLGTVSVPSDTELGTYDLIVWDSEINDLVVLED